MNRPSPEDIIKEALEVKEKMEELTLPDSILDGMSPQEYALMLKDPIEYGKRVDGDGE